MGVDDPYPEGYALPMIEIKQTAEFTGWLDSLIDRQAIARINTRIYRLAQGNPGDVKSVGDGVSELRIDYGPGYRVYFVQRGQTLIILLAGGDKRTQERDIRKSVALAQSLKEKLQ